MHTLVREFEAQHMKDKQYDFRPGDTVRVSVRIVEGNKERVQDFEGVCISRNGGGMGETFTVRRSSFGIAMERVFTLHSPRVEDIAVVRRGKVRRAKLTYLRKRSGKKARITEDLVRTREDARQNKERREIRDREAREAAAKAEEEAKAAAEAEEAAKAAEAEAEQAPTEEAAPETEQAPAEAEAAATDQQAPAEQEDEAKDKA